MAFQSIKKLLPDSCRCMNDELLDRLVEGVVRPPACLPRGYLAFVKREAGRLFPVAWDKTYREHCYTTGPPLSSTLENSRKHGGGLSTTMSHPEFLEYTLGTALPPNTSVRAKPMVVQSAGKPRPLTKFSDSCLVIKPLHKAIYDRLSSESWLLRGDVTQAALDKAGFRKGNGFLVSGDYKSATDNLPLEAAEVILNVALRNSSRVPEGIRDYARRLLRPIFLHAGEEIQVSSGQQMGSLLSFPLLCAQNYIAYKWAIFSHFKRRVSMPVLINGDDILFQSSDPLFYESWIKVVGCVGLEVESTKTSVSDDFGSLNSTLLRWRSDKLVVVPTLRFGMLRTSRYANSISKSFSSFACPGLPAQVRFNAGLEFVKWHLATILRTNLAPHELGFRGRFAFRCLFVGRAFTRVKLRLGENPCDPLTKSLPPSPCQHNIALGSEDIEWVDSLTADEERMNRREMASWKWRMSGNFALELRNLELRYWMGLSRPSVDVALAYRCAEGYERRVVRDEKAWYRRMKNAYFAPRVEQKRQVFFFRGLDRLPPYEEAIRSEDNILMRLEERELPKESKQLVAISLYEAGAVGRKG